MTRGACAATASSIPKPATLTTTTSNAAFDTISEKRDLYDTRVAEHTHRHPSTLDPVERAILWIGMYELIERFDIHPTVTINEAVELAKQFGAADSYKYINATLDHLGKTLRPNG